ncbi:hypothetical protein QBC38DRAFT_492069 [Podospora fimiseda]|uniref:Uncharacterized protein n=1 Tax=Podospora fimiseda TaxID=252190 RepID=A0AAN6YNU5_9PEZI|nr:hypothetical protein QBC38DRAFT_492069 [Podospora fimiseda]
MASKTFFLVNGWDYPKDSITLGSIITNPMHPQLALFKPETIHSPKSVSKKADYIGNVTDDAHHSFGLFRTFLRLYGLGDEDSFHYDRKRMLSYSIYGLESDSFEPRNALKTEVIEAERVAQFLRAGDYTASIFMVTGVKTVKGAGVTTGSSKGDGWKVRLNVDGETPVVFALELVELKASAAGQAASLKGLGADETVEELQDRLDRDFGKAIFTVIDGFDEENGHECKIVASSPAYLDLLTAGSARINVSLLKSPSIKE